jgi:hypothetical protein
VDDGFFLDPEHWPPDGLVWTGVSLGHVQGSTDYDPHSALAVLTVDDGANEEPRLVWYEDRPEESVSGLMLRYRREMAGFGGEPYLDAGAAEAVGLPIFELDREGHANRNRLSADNQWRTLLWRRGASNPFGSYPVAVLASPESTGDTLSLHLAVDTNCAYDEVDCSSGVYPDTLIDSVRVWSLSGPLSGEPVFVVTGLSLFAAGVWLPLPSQLPIGGPYQLAVELRNVGTATGEAQLSSIVELRDIDESPGTTTLTGSAVVTIPAGEAYQLELQPLWEPASQGRFLLIGPVWESGQVIGSVSQFLEIVGGGGDCPIPIVSLP